MSFVDLNWVCVQNGLGFPFDQYVYESYALYQETQYFHPVEYWQAIKCIALDMLRT